MECCALMWLMVVQKGKGPCFSAYAVNKVSGEIL